MTPWLVLLVWLGLMTIYLIDGQLLLTTVGDRASHAARQAMLAVPVLFGPVSLLLTHWRGSVLALTGAAALVRLAGHLRWAAGLRSGAAEAPPMVTECVAACCRAWATAEPERVWIHPAGPAVVGLGSRTLLLPPGLEHIPADELKAVLAHELAHVRRRDPVRLWLAGLLGALTGWHPVARVALNALRLEVEMEADARAAEWLGDARAYALALGRWGLRAAGPPAAPWGVAMAGEPGEVVQRVQTLVRPGRRVRYLWLPAWLGARLVESERRHPERPAVARMLPGILVVATGLGYLGLFTLALRFL